MVTMDCKDKGADHLANMGSKGSSDILYSQCAVPSKEVQCSKSAARGPVLYLRRPNGIWNNNGVKTSGSMLRSIPLQLGVILPRCKMCQPLRSGSWMSWLNRCRQGLCCYSEHVTHNCLQLAIRAGVWWRGKKRDERSS